MTGHVLARRAHELRVLWCCSSSTEEQERIDAELRQVLDELRLLLRAARRR